MPLAFQKHDVPISSDGPGQVRALVSNTKADEKRPLRVALVNNMPDAALEDTESQFIGLLNTAAGNLPIEITLFSLTSVPRGERAKAHLTDRYKGLAELLRNNFDGVIVTGTEPRQPDLSREPYWDELIAVLDWAEKCTFSTILSCLAAHAGVLYSDGILRQRMQVKRFGVFTESKVADHTLTRSLRGPICFPHSRWNDLRADELTACGYTLLTRSAEAGVGLFVKEKKNSLFIHFQGHPEYGAQTLLKEYRRDVRRFLRKERETYPSLPEGYFDDRTTARLDEFRVEALANPREEVLKTFPEDWVAQTLKRTWESSSVSIYRNWLQYIMDKRVQRTIRSLPRRDERD